jgi:hypothetical protein
MDVKKIFFVVIAETLINFVWVLYFVIALLYLVTSQGLTCEPDVKARNFPFDSSLVFTADLKVRILYHLFVYLWIAELLTSLAQFITSCATIQWYFNKKSDAENEASVWDYMVYKGRPDISLCKYLKWGLFHHLGSLVFGSLILACLQLLRYIVEFINIQMRMEDPENFCIKYLMCCLRCCLCCTEKLVAFINTHAYIELALNSTNFCYSAYQGMKTISDNIAKFGVFSVINTCLGWIVKFGASVASTVSLLLLLDYFESNLGSEQAQVKDMLVGSIVIVSCFVGAYIVSSVITDVYCMAAQVNFYCLCLELNDGGGGYGAKFCRGRLAHFIQKHGDAETRKIQSGSELGVVSIH